MQYGTSKEIITPCHKMRIACPRGSFLDNFTHIHDDVCVRCMVLEDGEEKMVFMSFDLLFHDRNLNIAIEKYAKETYRIKPELVIISYTHAHTAPASYGYNPGMHDDNYEEFLLDRAKTCLDRALCSMEEGVLEYGAFKADYNISRRGKKNGEFANAPALEYEHDRDLSVLCIRDTGKNVRAIVVNYACHPVFYPTGDGISGEFPARLSQLLDTEYYGATSLFFQSSGGDVRPYPTADFENNDWFGDLGFEGVDAFAKSMRDGICAFIEKGEMREIKPSFGGKAFEIELSMEPAPKEYFEKQANMRKDMQFTPDKSNAEYIAGGGYEKMPHSMTLFCKLLRISDDLYVGTTGGEPTFGVKMSVISALCDKDLIFIGYTDACAYVVDDKILAEGGYEAECYMEYRHIGPFKPGLNKKYTDSFKKAYKEIEKAGD